MKPTHDIHVIAGSERINSELEAALDKWNFKEIGVAGGDPRSVMKRLFSAHVSDINSSRQIYDSLVEIISEDKQFRGYIEAEAIKFDQPIYAKPQQDPVHFSFGKLQPTLAQNGDQKEIDLHFTVRRDEVSSELNDRLLNQTGFYFLDLQKPKGIDRVFTIQSRFINDGKRIFNEFKEKIPVIGGFRTGYLRHEITTGFKTFGGYSPPPIVYQLT